MELQEIKEKYSNIEDKIPSVFKDYNEAAVSLAQDIYNKWDIQDLELIRVISLVSSYSCISLTKHIDPALSYAGLYPCIMKSFDIKPDKV